MGEVYLVELVRKDFTSKPYMINFKEFFIPQEHPVINYLGYRKRFFENGNQRIDEAKLKADEIIYKLPLRKINNLWSFRETCVEEVDFDKKFCALRGNLDYLAEQVDILNDVQIKMENYLSNVFESEISFFFLPNLFYRSQELEFISTSGKDFDIDKVNSSFLKSYKNFIGEKKGISF